MAKAEAGSEATAREAAARAAVEKEMGARAEAVEAEAAREAAATAAVGREVVCV